MSKTVFGQDFFLHFLKKNRSDVNGVIIISNNFTLHQPFFQFVQIYRIFMLPNIKENANKYSSKKFQQISLLLM